MNVILPSPGAAAQLSKRQLSPARRQLVNLLSRVHFGRIESLHVRGGEPVFDPPPRLVRHLKIGGRNNPRPEAGAGDFLLKSAVVELLTHIEQVGDGVIERIEVAHGLPLFAEVHEAA